MPHPTAAFVLQGRSELNILKGFDDELARCLNSLGIKPLRINLTDVQQATSDVNAALRTYGDRGIVGAFSFSGTGLELGTGAANLNAWQQIKVPVVSWMLDHPCYILKRHQLPVPAVTRLYTTTDFMDFQRDTVKAPGRNLHCRFGAFTQGRTALRREPVKGEVPLIVFPKSLANLDELEEKWAQLPVRMGRIIRDSLDHYWGETGRWEPVERSVLLAGRASGVELQNDLPLFCFFIAQLDQYVRLKKANLLIKELLALPVRIYGNGAEHIDADHAKATLLPGIDYADLIEEYRKALAVISMNPNLGDDCHDRNYHAFGAGALPISDSNPWWKKEFPELQPYSYDFRDKPITAAVEALFDDPEAAADVAWKVGSRVREERPFEAAVKEAVEWAQMQRYFEFEFVPPQGIFIRSDLS